MLSTASGKPSYRDTSNDPEVDKNLKRPQDIGWPCHGPQVETQPSLPVFNQL